MEDKKSSKHNVDPKKVWENVKAKEDLTFTSKDLTSRPHKNFLLWKFSKKKQYLFRIWIIM